MILLLLVVSVAAANPAPKYVEAGASVRAEVPSYLLPGPMFDSCLIAAEARDRCLDESEKSLDEIRHSLQACQQQFDIDEDRIADLVGHVAGLEQTNARLRHQRNTALAVTGTAAAAVILSFLLVGS